MSLDGNKTAMNWEVYWSSAEEHNLLKHEPLISSTFGVFVLFFSTLLGTTANVLALKYFFTKNNVFFNGFKMVVLSDIFICLLSTFYGISSVAGRAPFLFANSSFCLAWNVSWKGVVRFSLHLVAIQSILRTLKICRPLTALPKHLSTVLVSLDLIMIFAGIFMSQTKIKPVYSKSYASCLEHNITDASIPSWQIGAFLNRFFPFPIIVICCVLCLVKVVSGNKVAAVRSKQRGRAHHRTQSMISLLVFSSTGLIFNAASFGPIFMRVSFYEGFDTEDGIQVWFLLYGNIIFRQIFITLNSVINPFIFLWRMSEFRQSVTSMKVFQSLNAIFPNHCCEIDQIGPELKDSNDVNRLQRNVTESKAQGDIQSNLQNNCKKNPPHLPEDVADNFPGPHQHSSCNTTRSSHLSTSGTRTMSRKMAEIKYLELHPIGTVIVHRNVVT